MLDLQNVAKTYRKGDGTIHAVRPLSCHIDPGELVVIDGPSGSGKSTLLMMIGGMLPPDEGSVCHRGADIYALTPLRRNRFRKREVGFVFQRFFLVPYLTVLDNIAMPLALQGRGAGAADRARAAAERLQIDHRLKHRPEELSVGEQQRVAVARGLVGDQELVLADEPSGNLDAGNIAIIAGCLAEESRKGRTIVVATHDEALWQIAGRRLHLEQGRLSSVPAQGI